MNLIQRKKTFFGRVDGLAAGIVYGWASQKNVFDISAKPIELEFLLNKKSIGRVTAKSLRNDIDFNRHCGFNFDLNPHLNDSVQSLQIIQTVSGQELTTLSNEMLKNSYSGMIEEIAGVSVRGWTVIADPIKKHADLEILIDGEVVGHTVANISRTDLQLSGIPTVNAGFDFILPTEFFDDKYHKVSARIAGKSQLLAGGGIKFKITIKEGIDFLSLDYVTGWVMNIHTPDVPIALDLYINNEFVLKTETNISRPDVIDALNIKFGNSTCGFNIKLPFKQSNWNEFTVRICIAGTNYIVGKKEYVIFNNDFLIQELESFASILRNEDVRLRIGFNNSSSNHFLINKVVNEAINQLRNEYQHGHITMQKSSLLLNAPKPENASHIAVDVIVPVYKGYKETLDCIYSVLQTQKDENFELIVINDSGPDVKLNRELIRLASTENFTLLHNDKNLGFVATVNKGMKLHLNRDVVLLNSDTVVPFGWLDRMRQAAYSAPNIGTVTPFSNRATICSLPRTCFDNDMPLGLTVDDIDKIAADVNKNVVVDIPTAIGFAMYIRRETLNDVGYFDEEKWNKGYGEENDFCVRAASQGWRNVAACDVFVQHHGSISFDADKDQYVRKNLEVLNNLYPDYPGKIQRFLRADPLAVPRGRINVALLKKISSSFILFISHGIGGGTEKAVVDLCDMHLNNGKQVLILNSSPNGKIFISSADTNYSESILLEYPSDVDIVALAEQLSELSIEYIQFHHTLGFNKDIWQLPTLLKTPYEIMLHDYYLVCPRITLLDDTGEYCGQPSINACESCVKEKELDRPVNKSLNELGGSVVEWRTFHANQLNKARKVITPSNDTKVRFQKYIPNESIEVIPHMELPFNFKQYKKNVVQPYRVALIGALGPHKGADVLFSCAKYALRRELPIEFVVIGYTSRDQDFLELKNVEITGKFKPEELPSMIEKSNCSTALFLSIWPETYSYTLSEAWRYGLYPIALDIGAVSERIKENGVGTLLPFSKDPQIIITKLLEELEALTESSMQTIKSSDKNKIQIN